MLGYDCFIRVGILEIREFTFDALCGYVCTQLFPTLVNHFISLLKKYIYININVYLYKVTRIRLSFYRN